MHYEKFSGLHVNLVAAAQVAGALYVVTKRNGCDQQHTPAIIYALRHTVMSIQVGTYT